MTESELQRAADGLAGREVCYCVSSLIYALREVFEQLDDSEEYMNLVGGKPDFEEAVREFIMNDASLDELEEVADSFGYWSDVLDGVGYTTGYVDHFEEHRYSDEIEAMTLEEWLSTSFNAEGRRLRELVFNLIDDYPAMCNDYGLEPEYLEIYEHWCVTDWFADKLRKRGEVVEDYLGLTIWGRPTTGQAISMDEVVRDITRNCLSNFNPPESP